MVTSPIYYNLEDKLISNAGRTAIFDYSNMCCFTIEAKRYKAGIYVNLNWWNTKLNDGSLNKYEKWVVRWNYRCSGKLKLDTKMWDVVH